jgi:hypothetical protein
MYSKDGNKKATKRNLIHAETVVNHGISTIPALVTKRPKTQLYPSPLKRTRKVTII